MRTLWIKEEGVAPYPAATLRKIEAGRYVLTPALSGDLDIDTVLSRKDAVVIEKAQNRKWYTDDGSEYASLKEAVESCVLGFEIARRTYGTGALFPWEKIEELKVLWHKPRR